MIYMEPLLIQTHDSMGDWNHPNISNILERTKNKLVKVVFIFGTQQYITIVVDVDCKSFDSMGDEATNVFIENLLTMFSGNFWNPTGMESFSMSRYGRKLNKKFPFYSTPFKYTIKYDVEIEFNGEKWVYKS